MAFNDNYYYKKLEINLLLDKLKDFSITTRGKLILEHLEEMNDISLVKEELAKVDEALQIIVKLERAPIYCTLDIDKIISDATKERLLSPNEIYEMVRLNSSIRGCKKLAESADKINLSCPYYNKYLEFSEPIIPLDNEIRKAIDFDGNILDDASPNLKRIRTSLRNIDSRIKDKLQQIISKSKNYLADSLIVLRDDRYCLMIKAEYKNSFKGILHDMSQSMQTCFMEPLEINQLANEKDALRNEEKMEEELILRELTNLISSYSENILSNYDVLVVLDLIFSKAMLAKSYDGECPKVNNEGIVNLVQARHPLLNVEKVIPNNISFGKEYLGIVITGPNTGGKTVLLKTVGLLSLMVKFGLLIPASSESNVMLFDKVFCDIGDDQSIADNLSTFSSHMKKMVNIVNNVTKNSLALFDEIGSGTDPVEGAAIAESVLDYFLKNNISFIVTTHYAELKAYAYRVDKVINASMAFEEHSFTPTYNLIIGQSGSSNAVTTAAKLGLKKEITTNAKKYLKENHTNELIFSIEKLSNELKNKQDLLNKQISDYQNKNIELDKRLNNIDKEKNRIINQAKNDANNILDEAKLSAEELLQEIKETNKKNLKLNDEIELKTKINELEDKKHHEKIKKVKIQNRKPIVGDRVYVANYEQFGNVVRINRDGTYEVEIGNIHIKVEPELLEITDKQVNVEHNIHVDIDKSRKRVSLVLDLRGKRLDEAKDELDKYIDDLIVSRINQATIIHGFGTGVIREMVQDYLSKSPAIASYRYGGANEGGLGVTVITLK